MDIGTWGWPAGELADALYPPDLPEEWRVGFFSGLFRCVTLPAELWRAADAEAWAEWLAEVPENFGFYLEQGGASAAELATAAVTLGSLLHGVLLEPPFASGVARVPGQEALTQLPQALKLWPVALSRDDPLAQAGVRVWSPQAFSVVAASSAAEFQAEIMDNAQSLLRSGDQASPQAYACLGLCRLPARDGVTDWSPLQLRRILEAAAARRVCAVVVTSGAEALTVMRQLETLSGLMSV